MQESSNMVSVFSDTHSFKYSYQQSEMCKTWILAAWEGEVGTCLAPPRSRFSSQFRSCLLHFRSGRRGGLEGGPYRCQLLPLSTSSPPARPTGSEYSAVAGASGHLPHRWAPLGLDPCSLPFQRPGSNGF